MGLWSGEEGGTGSWSWGRPQPSGREVEKVGVEVGGEVGGGEEVVVGGEVGVGMRDANVGWVCANCVVCGVGL